ncbi:5'-nucleotidase C-terminal domain-containing protein [Hymenobacter sp. BRD128]|uniref:5'-nucleotidase C-terminal domain-containing protein n=1 Tax=Hymenobacter sp. BRD128 TaxID=2675878 RepID=UPI0015668B31|nr:5'-nucleotidase C-terminal domain-containing protein [Hymenobacter sp. BRD128]QKG56316.1 5'-nucleotidase C-terminal domain-containing protein [Hymenobacter sp. BRD128]
MRFVRPVAASLLALALATGCQRGPLLATARLPAATSQPVGGTIVPDAGAADYIKPYHDKVVSEMQQVIGQAPVALGKNPGENPIVNFVADLQRTAASQYFKGEPIELGVMTNGGMRNALPAGPVTLGNVFELMPFENELLVLDAPGPVVQQLFDYAAPLGMAVSGAVYTVGPDKKPQQILVGGQPFDPAKTYRIAISDYLAGGGDHMEFLKAAKLRHTGLLLRTVIIDHIKGLTAAGQPVTARVEGRVKPAN